MLPFETSEYLKRIDNTKRRMAKAGLDVLLAADTANMNYLTGYDGWSFYTPQLVVVGLELDEPICIVRGIDRGGARVTTFLNDANIVGYPDSQVEYDQNRYVGASSKCLNIEKVKSSLPNYSLTSIEVGLQDTVDWFYESRAYLL